MPSSKGIESYIEKYELPLIKEYQSRVDSLYIDVYITASSLKEYDEGNLIELGQYEYPNSIIITNEEKFVAYELSHLSKFRRRTLPYNERTVKAAVFHELSHVYFAQLVRAVGREASHEYKTSISMFISSKSFELSFGSEFIEEGVCEFIVNQLGETPTVKDTYIPENQEDLLNKENKYLVKYQYSNYFLKNFLDTIGLEKGIKMLVTNTPPMYNEILHPELFFTRLK